MAIAPQIVYPGQVQTGDPGYPHGKARNVSTPGDGTGTPWEERIVNDLLGFQQDLLDQAGLTPSGDPDEVGASQYAEAVRALAADEAATEFESHTDGNEELIYSAPKTRTLLVPGPDLRPWEGSLSASVNPWSFDHSGAEGFLISGLNNAKLVLNLNDQVRANGALTRVRLLLKPGAVRTAMGSLPGDNGRMWAGVYLLASTFGTPSQTLALVGGTTLAEDNGTTSLQTITLSMGLTFNNKNAQVYMLVIHAGSDAGTNRDRVGNVELQISDPGPRSY